MRRAMKSIGTRSGHVMCCTLGGPLTPIQHGGDCVADKEMESHNLKILRLCAYRSTSMKASYETRHHVCLYHVWRSATQQHRFSNAAERKRMGAQTEKHERKKKRELSTRKRDSNLRASVKCTVGKTGLFPSSVSPLSSSLLSPFRSFAAALRLPVVLLLLPVLAISFSLSHPRAHVLSVALRR